MPENDGTIYDLVRSAIELHELLAQMSPVERLAHPLCDKYEHIVQTIDNVLARIDGVTIEGISVNEIPPHIAKHSAPQEDEVDPFDMP